MVHEEHSVAASQQPRGVHLVGSVPLKDSEAVFRAASAALGGRLRRIPDGETGPRYYWIGWQREIFAKHPLFEALPIDHNVYAPLPFYKLHAPTPASDITFDDLGYADAAKASYATFAHLKQAGVIPAPARFQVSLPTPLAPVMAFVVPQEQAIVEPGYEAALLDELRQITETIPHDQLAIQWDTALEFAVLEGVRPSFLTNPKADILERLLRLGNQVPEDVELGYHLCYGDAEHKHFKEPEDTSKLVEVANAVAAGLTRSLNWIHLPVPRNRTDDAYFAPLKHLRLHPETELYLGLVHFTDGAEGTERRIAAAQRTLTAFGVATECGMGRRPPETIPDLLSIHSAVAAPVTG